MAKLDPRVISVWRTSVVLCGTGAVVVLGVGAWLVRGPLEWWLPLSVVALSGAAVAAVAWTIPAAIWDHWSYELTEEALELRHGVLLREHSLIPWSRVQHVDVSHGPLDRRFGLAQLRIHTASAKSDADLPGLDSGVAEQLRLEILDRYRRSM